MFLKSCVKGELNRMGFQQKIDLLMRYQFKSRDRFITHLVLKNVYMYVHTGYTYKNVNKLKC